MCVAHANPVRAACRHAPMCLQYMEKVKDQQNFRFCAIPQVMAVGTLALCFNNHKVFSGELHDGHIPGDKAYRAFCHVCAIRQSCRAASMLDLCHSF